MRLLTKLLAVILALLVASRYVSGIEVESLYTALIVAILLGILNILVRPVLVVLTLPVTIITLGLFLFILNAALFWFVGTFVEDFTVNGFVPALLGSLIVSTMSWLVQKLS